MALAGIVPRRLQGCWQMALLGAAAVAMWWEMEEAMRAEFQDWHSHEHFPERMRIPGFRRGSRWTRVDDDSRFFVLYELAEYGTLASAAYRERLDNPTPWSVKMMPHHRNMVRSQCRVRDSFGSLAAACIGTIRLSPRAGREEALRDFLRTTLLSLPERRGLVGGYLLQTDAPMAALTKEQAIRGGDRAADWIVLVSGYAQDAVAEALSGPLGPAALEQAGAASQPLAEVFRLLHLVTPADMPAAAT